MRPHTFTSTPSASFKWLAPFLLSRFAWAFDFAVGPAGQCDPLNISWTGGTGPFSVVIAPLFEQFFNISIPSSSFNAATQSGSFSTQLALPAGQRFLLTMSDANGFGTGGVSSLLTTGSSVTGSQCNTTSPHPPFTFSFLSPLQQCSNFVFGTYDGSIQPNTIRALIPLGQVLSLTTDPSTNNFTWLANVAAGTSVVFIMTDSTGQAGGASDLETVSNSNDATCLNANSPHSTATSATISSASQTLSSSQSTRTGESKSGGVSTGEIAGIAAVAVVVILISIILAVFCLRRRNRRRLSAAYHNEPQVVQAYSRPYSTNSPQFDSIVRVSRQRDPHSVDLMATPSTYMSSPSGLAQASSSQSQLLPPGNEYQPQSYHYPPHAYAMGVQYSQSSNSSHYLSQSDAASNSGYTPQPQVDSQQPLLQQSVSPVANNRPTNSKSSLAQSSAPRFILHTDAEDAVEPDEEEVVELPPQYSERRAPTTQGPSTTPKN